MKHALSRCGWTVIMTCVALCSASRPSSPLSPPRIPKSPPKDFDCAIRSLALEFAVSLVGQQETHQSVSDALRLQECPPSPSPVFFRASATPLRPRSDSPGVVHIWVAVDGSDDHDGSEVRPLATLHAARDMARNRTAKSRAQGTHRRSSVSDPLAVVHVRPGRYYLHSELSLSPQDSHVHYQAEASDDEEVVLSGGQEMRLHFHQTEMQGGAIWEAELPPHLGDDLSFFTALFLLPDPSYSSSSSIRAQQRLTWAREPNGDMERQLQPDGYALVQGRSKAPKWPDPAGGVPVYKLNPTRNSSVYPYHGRDIDPRFGEDPLLHTPKGWQWLHEGGTASRFARNRSFWNGSVPLGLIYNHTGGIDKYGFNVSGFDGSKWSSAGYSGAIAHVFHNALWGNWQFPLKHAAPLTHQLEFQPGGWQEGHGGDMSNQPFFVEGVREALDVEGEWWVDRTRRTILLYPNSSWDMDSALAVVVPTLQTLVGIQKGEDKQHNVNNVRLSGFTFAHARATFMEPYEVPSPGDWSVHRGGAVFVDGAEDVMIDKCRFLQVNGNALCLSGHVDRAVVIDNEFHKIGDSAIVSLGGFTGFDGTLSDEYPSDALISHNHIHEVGLIGKQAAALFSALSCRVSFVHNVAYNGPRAGININDEFCHGHNISHNLLFNWVRETQDHGPINTWNRAMYLQPAVDEDQQLHMQSNYETPKSTSVPQWAHIQHNLLFNGPSGNRDLGNMFPAIDNDDGSAYFRAWRNVMVYGGAKNYLGDDKIWAENLIAYPDRWGGDPCAQMWAGQHNVYENNTCILGIVGRDIPDPLGIDGTTVGFDCVVDFANATNRKHLGHAASNVYYTIRGDWHMRCGNATADDHNFTLAELQSNGWELGSVVRPHSAVSVPQLIQLARDLLQL